MSAPPVLAVWWFGPTGSRPSRLERFAGGIRPGEVAEAMHALHAVTLDNKRFAHIPRGGDYTYFELMTLLSGEPDKGDEP
jgi:hypothetical protein